MMNNLETNIISQILGTAHFWSASFAADIDVEMTSWCPIL